MKTAYQSKLLRPAGTVGPDDFDDAQGNRPSDELVVSRRADGTVASVYSDLYWDLTAYHPERAPTKLNFIFWEGDAPSVAQLRMSQETRWIMFSLMWRLPGAPLSLGTLANYGVALRALASFADGRDCSVLDLLTNRDLLIEFAAGHRSNRAKLVSALTGKLARLGFAVVGESARAELIREHRRYAATLQQVTPMPSRIYSTVLTRLSRELDDWEASASDLLGMVKELSAKPNLGRPARLRDGSPSDEKLESSMDNVAALYGTVNYLSERQWNGTRRGLVSVLADVQLACKLTIQAFTGMRDDEAESLPWNCLEVVRLHGADHYLVHGRTTKLNHGQAKPVRWVTNAEGARAIRVAQQLASAIYAEQTSSPKAAHILFVNPRCLNLFGRRIVLSDGGRAKKLELASQLTLRARLQPLLEESDVLELEQIDAHRAWRSEEKFVVGQPWNLVSHQFRRSLALYAHRSGLVSLPSLRRQLQHITEEMSRYYARGSAFAKDFLNTNKDHFGIEWQATQPESSALGYIFSVLMAGAAVTGGHGAWVQNRMRDSSGTVVFDRDRTVKLFKRGELAYKETLLGGCTNTGTCEQRVFDWLDVDCLAGCQHMVVKLPNVERVLAALTRHVATLDEMSLEYRTQRGYLSLLTAAEKKLHLLENASS
jgi:hypothetical protein